ncbi:MAG: zinc metallopeptidase [Akkermansiaceae bacterium]
MKFLLMCGIIPVIASVLLRKFFCDRIVARAGLVEVSMTGRDFARAVLKKGKATEVLVEEKRRPFLPLSPESLVISPKIAESRVARDVAAAGLLAGLVLMARQQEKVFGWRKWAVKFGWAGPAFTVAIVIFGALSKSFTLGIAIGILFAVLGIASIALWMTLPVEREAAKQVAHFLEETNIVARSSEAEKLAVLVRALAWSRVVPGCVEWLVPVKSPNP